MTKQTLILVILLLHLLHACTPQRKAQNSYNLALSEGPFDAIIVPGITYRDPAWGKLMKRRVLWSAILYRNGMAKNIIYSGGAVYTPYKEAAVMGLYAEKMGIPRAHIFYDTLARHSIENVYYSYLIAQRQGFKRIALSTDRYQNFFLNRAVRRHFASPVYQLPVILDSVQKYKGTDPVINAARAKVKDTANYQPLTKTDNIWQRIKGMRGRHIPWKKYPQRRLPAL
ncbi:MAG: hypothetical protein K0Q79_2858 [Flavipsychrobacter sp.]|jgi:hypothetical protein|nr:hypothetical protein [Flavipsychrobacter sp.]